MGLKPICAKASAANMPQGPKPTTTGRSPSCTPKPCGAWQGACQVMSGVGWMCGFCSNCCSKLVSACVLLRAMSTMYTANKSALRASKLRLNTVSVAMSAAAMPSACAANWRKAASGWGVGRRSSSVSLGASAARRTSTGRAERGSLSSEIRIMATSVACGYQARSPFYLRCCSRMLGVHVIPDAMRSPRAKTRGPSLPQPWIPDQVRDDKGVKSGMRC